MAACDRMRADGTSAQLGVPDARGGGFSLLGGRPHQPEDDMTIQRGSVIRAATVLPWIGRDGLDQKMTEGKGVTSSEGFGVQGSVTNRQRRCGAKTGRRPLGALSL